MYHLYLLFILLIVLYFCSNMYESFFNDWDYEDPLSNLIYKDLISITNLNCIISAFSVSIVVSIFACHANDLGSIPRPRAFFFNRNLLLNYNIKKICSYEHFFKYIYNKHNIGLNKSIFIL